MPNDPIDLNEYFPFFLGAISNRWTNTSSRLYLDQFGIGIGEWRVLSSIRSLGQASSQEIVGLISMDAGAVSRSVAKLESGGFVEPVQGKFAGRTKPYTLTDAGADLHGRISDVALQREGLMLSGLNPDERTELLRLMRKIMEQLGKI